MASAHVAATLPTGQSCTARANAPGAGHREAKLQHGIFALNFAAVLIVLLGFCALALELGQVYNRKAELDGVAKAVALAAARELNGTQAGVNAAIVRAEATARGFKYRYGVAMPWSEAAITFGTAPYGSDWIDASSARLNPAGRYYVTVNAGSLLGDGVGTVDTPFLSVLPGSSTSVRVSDQAVAGRSAVNITPLAICAMSSVARDSRANDGVIAPELVEYGFRRGVNYDLMQLNPDSDTAAANFVVDPVFQPGASGTSVSTSASAVAPFVCTGNMWMPQVTAGQIRVSAGFPLSALYSHLNSRFDDFQSGACSPNGAPPDFNIKPYSVADQASVGWMTPKPTQQAALLTNDAVRNPNFASRRLNRLETVLDYPIDKTPNNVGASLYGPLWAYAKAAKYTPTAPATGETYFSIADWSHLYPAGISNGSATSPYQATVGTYYGRPSIANLPISKEDRRVLNIPLLSCPISGSNVPATVLAVGRFFMTKPATSLSIHAEFAGVAPEQSLTGPVELYP